MESRLLLSHSNKYKQKQLKKKAPCSSSLFWGHMEEMINKHFSSHISYLNERILQPVFRTSFSPLIRLNHLLPSLQIALLAIIAKSISVSQYHAAFTQNQAGGRRQTEDTHWSEQGQQTSPTIHTWLENMLPWQYCIVYNKFHKLMCIIFCNYYSYESGYKILLSLHVVLQH